MLMKKPGFTLIAVVTLALGIGANTTIFSFVNAVLLRPLPYKNADQLVVPSISFNAARGSDDRGHHIRRLSRLEERRHLCPRCRPQLAEFRGMTGGDGEPERVRVAAVSEDYFAVMGSEALIRPDNFPSCYNPPGPARGLIITYGLWQRRFGADANIVGQKIYLNGRPYPVVGVMPKDSLWPVDRDVLAPLAVGPNPGADLLRRDKYLSPASRALKPDVPSAQVNAALASIAVRLEEEHPESRQGWSNRIVGLRDYVVGKQLQTSLLILLATVVCVLLIACVNVANLLLVRAAGREREMAIRLALGAGRLRLIRQLLTESLLLTLIGGGLGLLLAVWGVALLKSVAPGDTPRLAGVQIDARVLLFTLSASLITAVVCG